MVCRRLAGRKKVAGGTAGPRYRFINSILEEKMGKAGMPRRQTFQRSGREQRAERMPVRAQRRTGNNVVVGSEVKHRWRGIPTENV